jgi:hypothetical protein
MADPQDDRRKNPPVLPIPRIEEMRLPCERQDRSPERQEGGMMKRLARFAVPLATLAALVAAASASWRVQ